MLVLIEYYQNYYTYYHYLIDYYYYYQIYPYNPIFHYSMKIHQESCCKRHCWNYSTVSNHVHHLI
ncbi:unnamed protein product [Schistosoma mattheei]|uniref:Uncharacterized protein n=1 Tax=Schistosoma mattheei TaxID=31246 RepID=A0A3P8F7D3_9TREM|nr:unnamed protein product [Schistosoma mattheei]